MAIKVILDARLLVLFFESSEGVVALIGTISLYHVENTRSS